MILLCTSWKAETIIALLALFVSIMSVTFTAIALFFQREHNKKSVKPIGVITVGDYENKIVIRLDNNGCGPLIIKSVTVSNETTSAITVIDIISDELKNRITWTDFAANLEEKAILAGCELDLLLWTIEPYESLEDEIQQEQIEQDRADLRTELKDLTITIKYTDIYEKNIFEIQRKMDWFGRHLE